MNRETDYVKLIDFAVNAEAGKYLVTGASGNIGKYLVRALLKSDDVSVVAMCHNMEKGMNVFSDLMDFPNFSIWQCDITEKINYEGDIDYIFHTAGICDNKTCINSPEKVIHTNIVGTENVLKFAETKKIKKFCFFSSASVYGETAGDNKEEVCGFSDFLNSMNAYAYSKRIGEMLCHIYENKFPVVILRPFHIIEPTMISDCSSMLGDFYLKASSGNNIRINTSGVQKRNFIWIVDLVNISIIIFKNGNGLYNIGNPNGTKSVKEMAMLMSKVCGRNIAVEISNIVMDKPSNNIDMVPELIKMLNISEGYSFAKVEDGLSKAIDVLKGN